MAMGFDKDDFVFLDSREHFYYVIRSVDNTIEKRFSRPFREVNYLFSMRCFVNKEDLLFEWFENEQVFLRSISVVISIDWQSVLKHCSSCSAFAQYVKWSSGNAK